MDFALGQFDLMGKIGEEVKYIRETNANKEKFRMVVADINLLTDSMETAPWFEANPNSLQLQWLRDYVPDHLDDIGYRLGCVGSRYVEFWVIPDLETWDFTNLGVEIEWEDC